MHQLLEHERQLFFGAHITYCCSHYQHLQVKLYVVWDHRQLQSFPLNQTIAP